VAKLLVKLTEDPSPLVRRDVADYVGNYAESIRELRDPKKAFPAPLFLSPDAGGDFARNPAASEQTRRQQEIERMMKVVTRLRELHVEEALRRLRDGDADAAVRTAAGEALRKLAALRAKGP
jgi:hypothetical protein